MGVEQSWQDACISHLPTLLIGGALNAAWDEIYENNIVGEKAAQALGILFEASLIIGTTYMFVNLNKNEEFTDILRTGITVIGSMAVSFGGVGVIRTIRKLKYRVD